MIAICQEGAAEIGTIIHPFKNIVIQLIGDISKRKCDVRMEWSSQIRFFEVTVFRNIGTGDINQIFSEVQEWDVRFSFQGLQAEAKSNRINPVVFHGNWQSRLILEKGIQLFLKLAGGLVVFLEETLHSAVNWKKVCSGKTKLLAQYGMSLSNISGEMIGRDQIDSKS
jgi:hypothetical protein